MFGVEVLTLEYTRQPNAFGTESVLNILSTPPVCKHLGSILFNTEQPNEVEVLIRREAAPPRIRKQVFYIDPSDRCAICLDPVLLPNAEREEEETTFDPKADLVSAHYCGHAFHEECIRAMIQSPLSNNCPSCKGSTSMPNGSPYTIVPDPWHQMRQAENSPAAPFVEKLTLPRTEEGPPSDESASESQERVCYRAKPAPTFDPRLPFATDLETVEVALKPAVLLAQVVTDFQPKLATRILDAVASGKRNVLVLAGPMVGPGLKKSALAHDGFVVRLRDRLGEAGYASEAVDIRVVGCTNQSPAASYAFRHRKLRGEDPDQVGITFLTDIDYLRYMVPEALSAFEPFDLVLCPVDSTPTMERLARRLAPTFALGGTDVVFLFTRLLASFPGTLGRTVWLTNEMPDGGTGESELLRMLAEVVQRSMWDGLEGSFFDQLVQRQEGRTSAFE